MPRAEDLATSGLWVSIQNNRLEPNRGMNRWACLDKFVTKSRVSVLLG